MITAVCFLLLAATVPLLGGRLSRLGEVRLRAWWTIVLALVIQVMLLEVLAGILGGVLAATAHLLSYGFALVFVWHNRHISGMALMVTGGLLNLAAIAANGGVMPAQRSALETAGIIVDSPEFENSAAVEDARLWFLGDVFAIPEGVPFANVFSIGDVILVLGGGVTVHTVARSRLGVALTHIDPLNRPDRAAEGPAGTVPAEPATAEVGDERAPTAEEDDERAPTAEEDNERGQRIADLEEQLRQAAPRLELLGQLETMADAQFETPEAVALRAAVDVLRREEQRYRREVAVLRDEYETVHRLLTELRRELLVDVERHLERQSMVTRRTSSEPEPQYVTERRRPLTG